ncbi:MAG: Na+/H+ antiporter subunit E [Candidatus Bathyarchaeia archaeon]
MNPSQGASRFGRFALLTAFLFFIWILLSGVYTPRRWDEILTGLISSAIISAFTSELLIKCPASRVLNPLRWIRGIAYIIYYFLYAEVKAHLDVIYRILHPSMPIRPGIVSVPCDLKTDFGLAAVACSITNTPGTVVVDVDEGGRKLFVHWINVISPDEQTCRSEISKPFEDRLGEVFE